MSASAEAFPSFDSTGVRKRDWSVIFIVGAAHSCSHFFQLVLPTLYLSLAAAYGYDFAQLGLLATIFFLLSCVGQASSGFVVDRVGPVPVLQFGLWCFVVSGLLIAVSQGYWMLLVAAAIGGIGNSVFHPVDYSILNHRVSTQRLGHGYSVHGLTGNLGWAIAPVYMGAFIYWADWRAAAAAAAALVAVVLAMTWFARNLLSGADVNETSSRRTEQATEMSGSAPVPEAATTPSHSEDLSRQGVGRTLQTLMAQPALWGAFMFFACTALAFAVIQNFTIPMLGTVYGIDKILAGTALSGYMLAGAGGMLAGGFLVSANPRAERTVFITLLLCATAFLALSTGMVTAGAAVALVAVAGFFSGVAGPSRDMLIRKVAPKGATGTVYGLVYSGMDVGASIAPVGFGMMLDAGFTTGPWAGAALGFVAAALLAMAVGRSAAARKQTV